MLQPPTLDQDAGPLRGLEARYYTDPEAFERDKERVFYRSWLCAGHLSELRAPGDYLTFSIVDEEVFVVRGEDARLRAFYNVCRHRGHPLVAGKGRCKGSLTCPYHAWTYGLDGQLRRAPGSQDQADFDRAGIRLGEVRLEVFCGLVFVNLDAAAVPLSQVAGHAIADIESFVPDPGRHRFICETRIEHDCNWKVSVENYNECYHCPTVHAKSLVRGVLDLAGYAVRAEGQVIFHHGRAQTRNDKQYAYDLDHGARGGEYGAWFIWPSMAVNVYPGGFFSLRQWLPRSHRKTTYLYRWFSDGEIADGEVEALMRTHRDTTGAEDAVVVAKVQRGMASRAYRPGPLVLGGGGLDERGVAHFQALYRAAVAA